MQRDLAEISDGKIYGNNDMVRAACQDCKGCHACCTDMGSSIILDPYDIYMLTVNLKKNFEQLMAEHLELNVVEGLILPNLKMTETEKNCTFLNQEGRCSIHSIRPGICRLFPLGRIYEDKGIAYFLQSDACAMKNCTKIKVSKWLDTPGLKQKQQFLVEWHAFKKQVCQVLEKADNESVAKNINMLILNTFFIKEYEEDGFYEQFAARMKSVKEVLGF